MRVSHNAFMEPNSHDALSQRRESGSLTWYGPALMLFARAGCAVGAQAVVAAVFVLRASPTPWQDAGPWLTVYGTLIDAGCLALLWRLTRHEGIRLFDLVGFDRTRLVRDTLLGFAAIPASLVFILGGIYAVGWLLYGTLTCVAFVWSLQHAFMPLTGDPKYMAFRLFSSVPNSVFQTLLYLRLRQLVPLAIAHAVMDGASVLIPPSSVAEGVIPPWQPDAFESRLGRAAERRVSCVVAELVAKAASLGY